jgi:hypothetical protein
MCTQCVGMERALASSSRWACMSSIHCERICVAGSVPLDEHRLRRSVSTPVSLLATRRAYVPFDTFDRVVIYEYAGL